MKIYRVGGAVRDALLNLPVTDIDYVVLGATPEQMLAQGYTPVGRDFPVFLHPVTHAEYALARTERKTAPGYRGFVFHCAPDITLEQDLQRRDLTINAMAIAEEGSPEVIDPYGGQRDLSAKLFRHVSPAFTEDPLRILRLARFAARLPEFSIAPETQQLMSDMVAAGEVDALVPERVWQELSRGFMERQPSRMLEVLHACTALARILPELALPWDQPTAAEQNKTYAQTMLLTLDYCAQQNYSLAVRWAALLAELSRGTHHANLKPDVVLESVRQLCVRLKVSAEVRDLAMMTVREQETVAANLSAQETVQLFERCDAFRRPERFVEMLQAGLIHSGVLSLQQRTLKQALFAAQSIPSGHIAQACAQRFPYQPQKIAEEILAVRIAAVELHKTSR